MKKKIMSILGILLIIVVGLNLTLPSEANYREWLRDEYNIQKSEKLHYYIQEDEVIFDSSMHEKMFGIFTMRQHNFEYVDNKEIVTDDGYTTTTFRELNSEEGLTIRTVEVGTRIFPIEKDNILWKILME